MKPMRGGKRAAMLAAVKRALKVGVPTIGVYIGSRPDLEFWYAHLTDEEMKRVVFVAPRKG